MAPRCATYDFDAGHTCATPPVVALDYWIGGRRLGKPFNTDYSCHKHADWWANEALPGGCLRIVVRWRWLTTRIVPAGSVVEPTREGQ